MFNIDELLDAARKGAGARSDRALSRHMGLDELSVRRWRSRKAMPQNDHVASLCQMANLDPKMWLIELQIVRSKGAGITAYSELHNILYEQGFRAQVPG